VSTFHDVRVDVAGKLSAAGVDFVTLDPASLPPFVLVDAFARGVAAEGIGSWRCELPIRIVAAPPADGFALGWLSDQLELVLRLYGFAAFAAEPYDTGQRTADGDAVQLPSYTYPLAVSVPNPDC
jgi:hypothetical protein